MKKAKRVESDLSQSQDLGELYEELFPRVYAYVSYRVGNLHQTEDLVSKVFLRATEKYPDFQWRHSHSFNSWIFKIAQNAIVDFYRSQTNDPTSLGIDDLPEIAAEVGNVEKQILAKERFKLLQELICSLNPRAQEVITLRFFGGLSNQEIASILELNERTVSSYLSRGLRDLDEKYRLRTAYVGVEGRDDDY